MFCKSFIVYELYNIELNLLNSYYWSVYIFTESTVSIFTVYRIYNYWKLIDVIMYFILVSRFSSKLMYKTLTESFNKFNTRWTF